MPRTRTIQNNFTAGELTPRMKARHDFPKYGNALETLTNFRIFPHGGVTRREGTRFVKEAKTSSQPVRVIPFEFSTTQAYVCEFGHQYIRFYTLSGRLESPPGTPVEVVSPYLGSELFDIHYAQSADVLYLVHPNHQPRKLSRTSATSFSLDTIAFRDGPYLPENTDHDKLLQVDGNSGTITITAVGHTPFTSDMVGSPWRLDFGYGWGWVRISVFNSTSSVDATVEGTFGELFNIAADDAGQDLRAAAATDTLAQGVRFRNNTVLGHIELKLQRVGTPTGEVWVEIRQADLSMAEPLEDSIDVSTRIDVTTISNAAGGEWVTFEFDRDAPGDVIGSPILNQGTTYFIVLRGNYSYSGTDLIQWRVSSASIYDDGTGYSQNSGSKAWTDLTADLAVRNTNTDDWRESAWSDEQGWPTSITFYEQRLFFGKDTEFHGSVIQDYETFSPSYGADPPIDENAVAFVVASQQVNTIQWLAGVDDLFVGTGGAEYRVIAANDQGITPSNIPLVREISQYGSSRVHPVRAGDQLLYISANRTKLREFIFSLSEDKFRPLDITLLAEHIGKRQFVEVAYQQDPDPTVWGVMADGSIAIAAYLKDQDVIGWCKVDTTGLYESVAVIPHPDGDASQVWVVVNRTIGGATKRYIEYFEDRNAEYGPLYTDSGLSYSGAATATLTGLDHLEGETVNIVGNMAVYPNQIVTSGQVTGLDPQVTTADVGLPYTSTVKTLRPPLETQNGTLYARPIGTYATVITLLESLGLTYNGDVLPFRKMGDPLNEPPPIFTGDKEVNIQGWDAEADVTLQQTQPLPCTILALSRTLQIGDA